MAQARRAAPKTRQEPAVDGVVRRSRLSGGLRVVTEAMPHVRSVSFGVWVGVGSRDEVPSLAGSSHFLEHLLFKGTRRRDALDIAAITDAVGGDINAFTTKEYTCYYARVLDRDLALAADVVCDMVTSALITSGDVESERGVVLEEIAMHDDDPGDVVHDTFATAVFGDTPLGRPVLGTVESIESLRRSAIHGYYRRRYAPPNIVVAAAGNVRHEQVLRIARKGFADVLARSQASEPSLRRPPTPRWAPQARVAVLDRPTEQAHVVLGGVGLARTDERRFALGVLNNALGGGMSSRLFQEIREKRGLAYSVYSFTSGFADTGLFGVYAGCHPKRASEVLALCREQLADVAERGITDEELARGKGQLVGALVLSLEDSGSRMTRIGKGELVYGELLGIDEVLARVEAVDLDDVRAVAADLLARPLSLGAIGPFRDDAGLAAAVA